MLKSYRTKRAQPVNITKKALSSSVVSPLLFSVKSVISLSLTHGCQVILSALRITFWLCYVAGTQVQSSCLSGPETRRCEADIQGLDNSWLNVYTRCGAVEMLYCFSCPELLSSSSIMLNNTDQS